MADVKVQKVEKTDDRTLPIFKQIDDVFTRIRQRAYELFTGRGHEVGHELDDWFAAEREFCWPLAELSEQDDKYVMSVAVPGFEPAQITVTATPRELIVQASAKTERREESDKKKDASKPVWSEFQSNEVFRRIELATPIDVSKVTANLTNGLLRIVAEKQPMANVRVPVAAAA